MLGDTYTSDGETFEVVWSGGEGLVAPRDTKAGSFWTAPKRLYNKKSDYWKNPKAARAALLDIRNDEDDDGETLVLHDRDPNEDL